MRIERTTFYYKKDTEYSEIAIGEKFRNILESSIIDDIVDCYRKFREIVDAISPEEEYEDWFVLGFNLYSWFFLTEIFEYNVRPTTDVVIIRLHKVIKAFKSFCFYGDKDIMQDVDLKILGDLAGKGYKLPDLKAYLDILELKNLTTIGDDVQVFKTELESRIALKDKELNEKLEAADTVLEKLNKASEKIGVQQYAAIFQTQANLHAKHRSTWLVVAIISLVLLIAIFVGYDIDKLFMVDAKATVFTPAIIVHVIGRFLMVSLWIFVISFAFKQYRVNMHLHTLNKHRANTLQSFEYLTNRKDVDTESYNAILREVAKAIYEAGQTGYVNTNDTNADIPSIVDMTKIIHSPK